jgi:predicted RNase H-like HicB family nuclease
MSIQFPITIKIIYEKESIDAPFVAYIPEFDISSCGKTEEEAVKNAREALSIVFEEVKKKRKLRDFLKEYGYDVNERNMFPKIIIEPFAFSF